MMCQWTGIVTTPPLPRRVLVARFAACSIRRLLIGWNLLHATSARSGAEVDRQRGCWGGRCLSSPGARLVRFDAVG